MKEGKSKKKVTKTICYDQCFLPSQTKTVGAEIMVDSQPLTRSNECQGGGVWEGGNTGVDGGLEDGLQPSRLDCHKKSQNVF